MRPDQGVERRQFFAAAVYFDCTYETSARTVVALYERNGVQSCSKAETCFAAGESKRGTLIRPFGPPSPGREKFAHSFGHIQDINARRKKGDFEYSSKGTKQSREIE